MIKINKQGVYAVFGVLGVLSMMIYKKRSYNANLTDYGSEPFIINIDNATKQNDYFRTTLWTGNHLQLTLMSIPVGGEIGLEMHHDVDQFLRLEAGYGLVLIGHKKEQLYIQQYVSDGFAIFVPAGTWHNVINVGNMPIKLYSIYAPPQHPHGTIHQTKEDAEAAEKQSLN